MARVEELWVGVTPIRVPCAGDCGRLVPAGSGMPARAGMCAECVRFDAELEQRHARLREQFGGRLLGHRELRLAREAEAAAPAGDPERRSRLLAGLPRRDAGVAEEVCEAEGFPTILTGSGWRQLLLAAGVTVCGLGVACGVGVLLLLGARDAMAWLRDWSA